jgi:hypothetical protein
VARWSLPCNSTMHWASHGAGAVTRMRGGTAADSTRCCLVVPRCHPPFYPPDEGKQQQEERCCGLAHCVETHRYVGQRLHRESNVQPRRHPIGQHCIQHPFSDMCGEAARLTSLSDRLPTVHHSFQDIGFVCFLSANPLRSTPVAMPHWKTNCAADMSSGAAGSLRQLGLQGTPLAAWPRHLGRLRGRTPHVLSRVVSCCTSSKWCPIRTYPIAGDLRPFCTAKAHELTNRGLTR